MTGAILYGQAQSERAADENETCRQIVKEISNFGITQRQSLMVIYLMAMELDDIEKMRSLTSLVRELGGEDLFLIGAPENDREVNGDNDGTTDVRGQVNQASSKIIG